MELLESKTLSLLIDAALRDLPREIPFDQLAMAEGGRDELLSESLTILDDLVPIIIQCFMVVLE